MACVNSSHFWEGWSQWYLKPLFLLTLAFFAPCLIPVSSLLSVFLSILFSNLLTDLLSSVLLIVLICKNHTKLQLSQAHRHMSTLPPPMLVNCYLSRTSAQALLINMLSQWSSSLIGNRHTQVHVYVSTHPGFLNLCISTSKQWDLAHRAHNPSGFDKWI